MNEKFARWSTLFVEYIKRDWKKILVWVIGLGLFSGAFVPAFEEIGKGQGLIGMYETMQNPAMTSMVGPSSITSPENYTLGAMYAHEMLLFCGLFAMIISALHVVSHTRKEEELGLTELVRSFRVGRQANSFAVMCEVIVINLLLGLCIGGIMSSFRADTITVGGSFLFGISIAMAGILGGGFAIVMAQIMPTSTGTTGATLGFIGLLYILRGATDLSNLKLSRMNPMGWIYLTFPFTENHWYPLIFAVIATGILIIIAFFLEGKRDMGAGFIPEKPGRSSAKKTLLSVPGLFIKLNKGMLLAWWISYFILGAAYGSIYGDMQSFLESNELISQMFMVTGVSMEASFTATIIMVMLMLVGILPVAIMNKVFQEESRMHLSQLFSTKVTRGTVYWTNIGIAVISGIVGIFLAVLGLGGTAIAAMGEQSSMNLFDFMKVGFNFLPSIIFLIGLSALSLGFAPRLGKAVYLYLGYSFAINYFGGILDLPEVISKTAIQSWIPRMPVEKFDGMIFFVISVIGIGFMLLGFLGYKQRDMIES